MLGNKITGPFDLKKRAASRTQDDAMRVVRKLRQAISAIKYLNHQILLNVNGRLTAIVNNISDQFRASQAAHNAAYPMDKTTIANF